MYSKEELEESFQVLLEKAKHKRRLPLALAPLQDVNDPALVSVLPIGTDGMKTSTFLRNPAFHYQEMLRKLQVHKENPAKSYHFRPLRALVKYTKSGKARTIYTYSLVDQIVLKAVHLELKKTWKFAQFQSKHPMDTAWEIHQQIMACGKGVRIVKTDIAKFFPSINRERLFADLANESAIRPEVYRLIVAANTSEQTTGVVTGGALSTLLSEFYIRNIKTLFPAEIGFHRFADDICLVVPPSFQASAIKSILRKALKSLDLQLSNEKSKTIDPFKETFEYLGITFEKGKPVITADEVGFWRNKVSRDVFSERGKLTLYQKLNPQLSNLPSARQIQDTVWQEHFRGLRSRFWIKYTKYKKYVEQQ